MGNYIFGFILIVLIVSALKYIFKNRKNYKCDGNCSNCTKSCKK